MVVGAGGGAAGVVGGRGTRVLGLGLGSSGRRWLGAARRRGHWRSALAFAVALGRSRDGLLDHALGGFGGGGSTTGLLLE